MCVCGCVWVCKPLLVLPYLPCTSVALCRAVPCCTALWGAVPCVYVCVWGGGATAATLQPPHLEGRISAV